MTPTATILLLGSGELGREFVISAKRLGCRVIACDSYDGAPAMQVADDFEVFSMLDGAALRATIEKHRPDHRARGRGDPHRSAEGLRGARLQRRRLHAPAVARNRDAIRDLAASELGLTTSTFEYAETREDLRAAARIGFPLRGQAGDVVVGQGPEHGQGRRRHRLRMGLCRRRDARRPAARDRRSLHRFRLRDHVADRPAPERRDLLPADRPPPGTRRLSRKLAAGGDVRCRARQRAGHGDESRRRAGRSRHFRRRIFRQGRRGHLFRTQPPPTRHRHGHPDLAAADAIRPPRPRYPRPAYPRHRGARRQRQRRPARRPRCERFRDYRPRRRAGGAQPGNRDRCPHFRQAGDAAIPPHGRRARARRSRHDRRRAPRRSPLRKLVIDYR